jgi:CHASE1-domain containing sensor protein
VGGQIFMTEFDTAPTELPGDILRERNAIERAGRLHIVHWIVISLSLVITVAAWQLVERRAADRFARYTSQVIELVTERMGKYEDALWGGVSVIYAKGGDIDHPDWKIYADSLRIDSKYPGINGIGVIHYVAPGALDGYLRAQRKFRPDYRIHPPH